MKFQISYASIVLGWPLSLQAAINNKAPGIKEQRAGTQTAKPTPSRAEGIAKAGARQAARSELRTKDQLWPSV